MAKTKSVSNTIFNSRFTSVISISLVIFLVGLITTLILLASDLSVVVRETIGLSVVLRDDLKAADIQKLIKTLDASDYVKSTTYIDKESAAKELAEELGEDPTEFLGYNPLSASIEMKLVSDYANNDSIAQIEARLNKLPEVKEVIYQKNLIEAVNENVARISAILLAFSIMLLLISYALIANTIRLSVYSKRFLIHTMKLVGATGRFIRRPFLLQGAATGIISAFIAIGMLSAVLYWAQSEVSTLLTSEMVDTLLISFAVMVVFGLIITFIATYHAVNRALKLTIDDMYYM